MPTLPGASKSRRYFDMTAADELAAFLDSYFYGPLLAEGNFTSFKRIHDRDLQLKGVDVELSTASLTARIDEKAQLYYINKDLPTFAFELQFLHDGQPCTGWFLNETLLTDYYLLIWPKARVARAGSVKKDDFTELDALMVSRKKLHGFLDRNGLSRKVLEAKAALLRPHASDRKFHEKKIRTGLGGVYYRVSDPQRYAEAPINLVIGKRHLLSIASAHYKITKNGFERLPR